MVVVYVSYRYRIGVVFSLYVVGVAFNTDNCQSRLIENQRRAVDHTSFVSVVGGSASQHISPSSLRINMADRNHLSEMACRGRIGRSGWGDRRVGRGMGIPKRYQEPLRLRRHHHHQLYQQLPFCQTLRTDETGACRESGVTPHAP